MPAPSASPGSRRAGNGASAEGLAPSCEAPVFRPSPVFPHWLVFTMIGASWGFPFVTAFLDEIRANTQALEDLCSSYLSYESLLVVTLMRLSMTSVARSQPPRPEKQ